MSGCGKLTKGTNPKDDLVPCGTKLWFVADKKTVSESVPSRDGLPYFNLNRARAIRHEEIRLGRSMTPAEQEAHIRKLCR